MPTRNVILRIMLWSLGLAAATGVLTVFVQSGTVMWRLIGTELCAAVACALLLPCIPMIDRRQTRAGGLLGMAAIVVEFILALMVIWQLPSTLAGVRWEDELGSTMLIAGLAVVVLIPLLRLKQQAEHTVAARCGMAVVVVAASAFLIAAWGTHSYRFGENCAESGAAILCMGAIVAVCLLGMGAATRCRWRWLGVLCAVGALALWMGDIWIGAGSDVGFVAFVGLIAASAVVAYAVACRLVPLKATQQWFRDATIGSAALTAVLIELWMIADRHLVDALDAFWLARCTAAAGIVTGCGILALAVLARMNRRVDFEIESDDLTDITVICPRCRKKQSLPFGDARCGGCGLRISIRIEEPRCPNCEYLLIGLTSDRCPECGTEVGQAAGS